MVIHDVLCSDVVHKQMLLNFRIFLSPKKPESEAIQFHSVFIILAQFVELVFPHIKKVLIARWFPCLGFIRASSVSFKGFSSFSGLYFVYCKAA